MDERKQQLFDRLDQNLSDYHDHLRGFQPDQLIDMADRIALTAQVHGYLPSQYEFGAGEVERLLQFQNPLEVLTDAWAVQRMDIDDLDYVIYRTCEQDEILEQYPLVEQGEAAVTPADNPLETLRQRLDENLRAYEAELLSLTPKEVYDRADEATAVKDAHYYLTDVHDPEPDEAAYLLGFQNPLEVVADGWRERRDGMEDMSYVLDNIFDSREATGRYAPAEQREPIPDQRPGEKPSILAKLHKAAEQVQQQSAVAYERKKDIDSR